MFNIMKNSQNLIILFIIPLVFTILIYYNITFIELILMIISKIGNLFLYELCGIDIQYFKFLFFFTREAMKIKITIGQHIPYRIIFYYKNLIGVIKVIFIIIIINYLIHKLITYHENKK